MANMVPTSIGNDYLAAKAKDAIRMEEKKMSPGLIFDASSVVRTPGGYLDVVTGDKINLGQASQMAHVLDRGLNPAVGDFIDMPELYKASPGSAMVTVEKNPNLRDVNAYGAYEHGYDNIALLYSPIGPNRAGVLAHELQHDVDYKGINNENMMKKYINGIYEPYTSESERRAYLVEMATKEARTPKEAKQAIFDVVSKGLPVSASKAEDAIFNTIARNKYLNIK